MSSIHRSSGAIDCRWPSWLRTAGQLAWRGFSFFFKIWIAVTLVAYVVAFVAAMIGLTTAGPGRSSGRDNRRGGGFGLPWIWYLMMPDLAPAYGPYSRAQSRSARTSKKRFYQSVFDFVFGPKKALSDPKELEKQLVSFLRAHKGRVTAAELSALTGLGLDAADEELTRLMVDYDGEVEVAEDGTLLYVFDDLMQSAGQSTSWSWDFEKREAAVALTGNSAGTNAVVGGFAGFNLLASLTIGPTVLERAHLTGEPWAWFFALWFPLVFSLIFFVVPAARWVKSKQSLKRQNRRALRRALWREIWSKPGAAHDPAELSLLAATRVGATPEAARQMLEQMLPELDGDVDTDEAGNIRYRFPRLAEQLAAVAEARAKSAPAALGRVIFSSDDAKLQ